MREYTTVSSLGGIYFPLAESSKGHRFLTRKLGKELGAPNPSANICTAQAATPAGSAVSGTLQVAENTNRAGGQSIIIGGFNEV